jgi:hypothetical protein
MSKFQREWRLSGAFVHPRCTRQAARPAAPLRQQHTVRLSPWTPAGSVKHLQKIRSSFQQYIQQLNLMKNHLKVNRIIYTNSLK